jgi:hypothetical protein
VTKDWWVKLQSDLLWHQTHGSGFALTRSDLLQMTIGELLAMHEQVNQRRHDEAEEIRRAAKARR